MYNVRITLSAISDVVRRSLLALVLISAVGGWCQSLQPPVNAAQTSQQFDGKWWIKTSPDEHSGFINGADDCLTWTAHKQLWTTSKKHFSVSFKHLNDLIGEFYESHPESRDQTVVDVWRKVMENPHPNHVPGSEHAETWKNPHWYLDGFWWLGDTPDERTGFVEGYLWCMRTQVPVPSETYSKPVGFYVGKIDAFTKANGESKANREKVAVILKRYKDTESAATPK
jgi:hypothetical protein